MPGTGIDYNLSSRNDNDYGWKSIQDKKQAALLAVSAFIQLQRQENFFESISVRHDKPASSIGGKRLDRFRGSL